MTKKVVVTGLGAISSLGNDIENIWGNLLKGEIGIEKINHFDTTNFETKIAGTVKNFNVLNYVKDKLIKKLDLFIQYGVAAGIQAIEDANINNYKKIKREKIGVIIGSGIGGLISIEKNYLTLLNTGPKKINPSFIPNCIINTISGYISKLYNFTGPSFAISNACATGGYTISIAEQLIKNNRAKIIIAGGAEYASIPLVIGGFNALNALSKNTDPKKASRPWDIKRNGFVISDGAACLVLEEYEHAMSRNCKIYAEIAGTYINNDAYHIISPHPTGEGSYLCMKNALKKAKIKISDLDYINAHATSTKKGDISEGKAIENLTKKTAKNIIISSTKSQTGHLLGASGAIEAIITILCIKNKIILSNKNLDYIDSEFKNINLITKNVKKNINYAMSNSFGFGGTNSSIIIKNLQK